MLEIPDTIFRVLTSKKLCTYKLRTFRSENPCDIKAKGQGEARWRHAPAASEVGLQRCMAVALSSVTITLGRFSVA